MRDDSRWWWWGDFWPREGGRLGGTAEAGRQIEDDACVIRGAASGRVREELAWVVQEDTTITTTCKDGSIVFGAVAAGGREMKRREIDSLCVGRGCQAIVLYTSLSPLRGDVATLASGCV
jgi:hypothetical protein